MAERLNLQQTFFFRDRCDIYKPTLDKSAGGIPGGETYSLDEANVKCMFITKSSVDQPLEVGLVEGSDLMTVDELHLAETQPLETNWIVKCRSKDRNGNNAKDYGDAWKVFGPPMRQPSYPGWDMGNTVAFLSRVPPNMLPPGIPSD